MKQASFFCLQLAEAFSSTALRVLAADLDTQSVTSPAAKNVFLRIADNHLSLSVSCRIQLRPFPVPKRQH
ncbi:MAG: hypothetical protein M3Q26_07235 [Acidobacteriota bacterium]|nr:hypothetical protein [Acidobacteriota bacterium]